jgi:hypothetical protein
MDFSPLRRADADLRIYVQGTAEPPITCGTQAVDKSPNITFRGLRLTRRISDQAVRNVSESCGRSSYESRVGSTATHVQPRLRMIWGS